MSIHLGGIGFEWDPDKSESNRRDHGIEFADAITVLADDLAITHEDPDAEEERRFVTLGMDASGVLLVVVYSYRDPDVIRIISAWKANKWQRKQYEEKRR